MKQSTSKFLYLCILIMVLGAFATSCKKDKGNSSPTTPPGQLSDADSLKYIMYNLMQVSLDFADGGRDTSAASYLPTYYWYNQVPKLNPLSSTYDSADVLLNAMKTYAINPTTGKPYDKYSFLDKTGAVAAEIQQGQGGDLGMEVSYAQGANNKITLNVLYADKNSPAGKVGITRGWQITAINGSTNISYDGSNGPNVAAVIKAVYNAPSSSFTFLKPDGSTATYTLSQSNYNINPVLFDSVYNVGGKNVGYFVFYTFSSVYNSDGSASPTQLALNNVFSKFESANVSDVIVDLRYNGGGSVATSEYIDSLLAPSSVKGKVMYNYLYNDKLTALAKQQPGFLQTQVLFTGGGGLNLTHVFFIGTGNTASASELTLNNLKPYLDIKLVGDTTYGKPVGFFSFTISDYPNGVKKDLADLYAINFETRNADNNGGYFNGLIPDQLTTDFVDVPWGDSKDDNLVKIFKYISTGSFSRLSAQQRMAADQSLRMTIPSTIHPLRFNGMVDYKNSSKMKTLIDKSLRRAQ